MATGIITNSKVFAPRIAIIGLPPAGGCTVLVNIIAIIAKPTPMAIEIELSPIR